MRTAMMRYSEISRDLSTDSLRYVELGNEYIYKNLREESSPPSDISNYSVPLLNRASSSPCQQHPMASQPPKTNGRHSVVPLSDNEDDDDGGFLAQRNSERFTTCNNTAGNGTVNGAATISYLRQRQDSIKSTQSSCQLNSSMTGSSGSKTYHAKSASKRKNSVGCLNALSSSPSSPGCYYCVSATTTTAPGKTQSLPAHSSISKLDSVIFSALRLPADELANQITLLDFPVFAGIQPDELTSCAWTKKDKHTVTPNIVAFTKRFNHTIFWTVQEILGGEQPKQRAEILTHFIKVAKKLHELNNLHSLFAIISAMQSASIYRLRKTWSCLSKKDRQSFERLSDIFSDQNNWANLRSYLESLRLPCIPYLGLFLTDLIYIDLAHPYKGGLEPEARRNRMNNILRVIANYQQSDYANIMPIPATQNYLTSIRYIEELQNIFEEDQYKKSLKLEPISPSGPSSSSCSSKESFNVDAVTPALTCLNLSPAKTIGSMRITSGAAKFIPGHRKCHSLGTKFRSTSLPRNLYHRCQCSILLLAPGIGTISNKRCRCRIFGKLSSHHTHGSDATQIHQYLSPTTCGTDKRHSRHLLDDSVLEHCVHHPHQHAAGDAAANESALLTPTVDPDVAAVLVAPHYCYQGCVRRKTLQKEGRKPAVASWQRYWLQIWANSLVYFPPKSFKGSERADFKREPCKVCPLNGWYAQLSDNPKHKNSFELYHRTLGTVYKFRTDSAQATQLWTNSICTVAMQRCAPQVPPINLMSFE